VSIFAEDCADALRVERVAAGFDPDDPYSRRAADGLDPELSSVEDPTLGVPAPADREFFGDRDAERLFDAAVDALKEIGVVEPVDPTPFYETASLLYGGPWIAERFAAVGEFMGENPGAAHPVVEGIIREGESYTAVETFEAFQELEALGRSAEQVMDGIDALVVPTTGTTYTIEAVRESPVESNSRLGYYTNFVNLLDLSAVSVPTGRFDAGPTFGVTVVGEAFEDATVASIAAELREASPYEETAAARR
jgi:allophanate hydrolase